MDFNSLFASLAPQLAGMADPAPMAGAAPTLPGAPPMPQPAPTMMAPRPMFAPQPQPRQGGGAMETIRELAPIIMSAFTAMKDPAAAGALMAGVARGREMAYAKTVQAENRDAERRELAAKYMQQVAADASQFDNVEEHQKYLQFAEQVGQAFGIQPGTLSQTIPFPKTKQATAKRLAAQKRLTALESNAGYKDIIGTPQESGLSVDMEDGERLTVAQLRERAGMALYDPKGAQVVPTPAPKPEKVVNTTDYGDALARYAKKIGKPVEELTFDDEVAAKKALGQADDRPTDPAIAGLRRESLELTNELKRSQIANKSTAGLPASAQRRVDTLARGFDQQAAVKRAGTMAEAVAFANGMSPTTTNPADDQALIYAFAKAMDPDSVVREGEYATVQKYAQSWAEKFGFDVKRVFTNTAFLTPQARANMKATVQQKFAATKTQYDNLRRSYAERINRITGAPDGAEYLTDYAGGFPSEEKPTTTRPPATGQGATVNGYTIKQVR